MSAPTAVERILTYARSKIGDPYVYGGDGPSSFDCSGLFQEANAAGGVFLGRTAAEQATEGWSVSALDPQLWLPGDGLFLSIDPPAPNVITHVQLFVDLIDGVAWIIEAPHTGGVVWYVPEWAGLPGQPVIQAVRRYVSQTQLYPPFPGYLRPGMTGGAVAEWQTALITAGFSCGVTGADGVFGPATLEASKKWAASAGFAVVDQAGIVGPGYWSKMFGHQ